MTDLFDDYKLFPPPPRWANWVLLALGMVVTLLVATALFALVLAVEFLLNLALAAAMFF
jgi:hypothetical protein